MDVRDSADIIDRSLSAENTENRHPKQPIEPTDKMDPAEPMDRIEPLDPIDKMDPLDPMDKMEPDEPRLSTAAHSRGERCLDPRNVVDADRVDTVRG
jgi:hypothetical protein